MSSVVIGIDGGTTETIALVANLDVCILGAARGNGSNRTDQDMGTLMLVVIQTVREVLDQAGAVADDVLLGVFTLAGADWPEDHEHRQVLHEQAGLAHKSVIRCALDLNRQ